MAYTTINKPSSYFNTILYTGTSSAPNAKTGVGFQPDLVWIKPRTLADNHRWHSPLLTGTDYFLKSNSTDAEAQNASSITSFDSDGFTLGNADSGWNNSSYNYVAWNWLAGNGTSSNTDGSITSTVSANTTSGFSIVTYTGTGATATIGHGLGVAPKVVIIKGRSNTGTWGTYHSSLGATQKILLNDTAAAVSSGWMSNTAPTSNVFTVINDADVGSSGYTYVAYCFAEKKGFSKFGSYIGNGNADGTFIYTGFKPAFIIIKETNGTNSWQMHDNKRPGYNLNNAYLQPNTTATENTLNNQIDILSNGIKLRSSNTANNGSGQSFMYMAFAEHPLVSSTGVPCTAR